jgi:hypothetical protein
VWTLKVNGKMLLRTVDGAGIRQMAAHLKKHLCRPVGQRPGSG